MSYGISSNQLQPNFAEIELVREEVAVFRAEYSKELFDECIDEKGKKYFYHRDGKYLYALPENKTDERPIGFDTVLINSQSCPGVLSKLIAISLKQFFELHKRKVFKKKYSSLYSFRISSEQPFQLDALELSPYCNFSVHHVTTSSKPIFIFTLAKEYKPYFVNGLED